MPVPTDACPLCHGTAEIEGFYGAPVPCPECCPNEYWAVSGEEDED
jgi:hypothetical protein